MIPELRDASINDTVQFILQEFNSQFDESSKLHDMIDYVSQCNALLGTLVPLHTEKCTVVVEANIGLILQLVDMFSATLLQSKYIQQDSMIPDLSYVRIDNLYLYSNWVSELNTLISFFETNITTLDIGTESYIKHAVLLDLRRKCEFYFLESVRSYGLELFPQLKYGTCFDNLPQPITTQVLNLYTKTFIKYYPGINLPREYHTLLFIKFLSDFFNHGCIVWSGYLPDARISYRCLDLDITTIIPQQYDVNIVKHVLDYNFGD